MPISRALSLRRAPEDPASPRHSSGPPRPLEAPGLRPARRWGRLGPPHLIVGFPVTALLRHAVPARAPAPAPAAAPLSARAGPQAAEPAQAPTEPQQAEQGRVLPGLGCARPRRAAAAPQSYPHSLGPVAPSAAAPSPAGAPRPAREAAPRGARPGATAAARRRRHLGTVRGAGEAGGGAAQEQGRGEGRAGRGGAAAAHDNNRRRRGSGGSRGLGRPRAGHHGSGSPRPVGRHLRPHLRSTDPATRPKRGEAQGPQGNVVQEPRFFRRELGPRELGLLGSGPNPERKPAPEPPGGVVFAPDSSHRSCAGQRPA